MSAQGSGSEVFELRPLNIADLLDQIIRIYRRHFGELMAIAAVVFAPLAVIRVALSYAFPVEMPTTDESPEMLFMRPAATAPALIVGVLGWLVMSLMEAAVAKAVSEYYLGGETGWRSAYRFAARRWVTLILAGLLVGIAVWGVAAIGGVPALAAMGALMAATMGGAGLGPGTVAIMGLVALLGMLVALLAWVAMLVKLAFATLSVVLEDRGAWASLGRSWDLTRGHFWRVGGTLLLLGLLIGVAVMIIVLPPVLALSFLMGSPTGALGGAIMEAVVALAQLLMVPLGIIGTVLLYYDLRIRKEGFDLAMMAEAIGEPERVPRPEPEEARAPLFGQPEAEGEPLGPPPPPARAAPPERPPAAEPERGPLPPPPPRLDDREDTGDEP
jgi:hypothetical protein